MSEVESPTLHPRRNPNLLGQAEAEARMLAAQDSGRLPHAWLLTGRKGIGKATLAYRFARFLLSEPQDQGLFAAPADSLAISEDDGVFRRIAASAHPDLMTVELGFDEKKGRARREILVNDVRSVVEFLHRTPAEGGWRIVIVDSADEMNRSAANALLKVLEEPPEQALLLLVSHTPGRLLPTIRSRCCRLALPALPPSVMEELLAAQRPDLEPANRQALCHLAEGSIGRALELDDAGGLGLYNDLVSLLKDLPRLDVPAVHSLGDRLARGKDGQGFRTTMELLSWWLARLIRGQAGLGTGAEVVPGEGALPSGLRDRGRLADWIALWEKIADLTSRAEGVNLDRKQVLIAAFLELQSLAIARN